jgi:hypothetical protein
MQILGYLIIAFIILLLLTTKEIYSRDNNKVKTIVINKSPGKEIVQKQLAIYDPDQPSNINTGLPSEPVNTPFELAPVYEPDQPSNINTGLPSEPVNTPFELAPVYEPDQPSNINTGLPSDYDATYKCDLGILVGDTCNLDSYERNPTMVITGLSEEELQNSGFENDENNDIRYVEAKRGDPYPFEFRQYEDPCEAGYKPIQTKMYSRGQRTKIFHCASNTNTAPAKLTCRDGDILNNGGCNRPTIKPGIDPKYKCDMGILLGDKCSIEMFPMQPTNIIMGLTEEQAKSKVNENDSDMVDTIIKKIGMTGRPNAIVTYNVEYYDKTCRSGYKRATTFDTIGNTPSYYCASDRIPQHTVPSIPYCDDGFTLNDARCIADITAVENGI